MESSAVMPQRDLITSHYAIVNRFSILNPRNPLLTPGGFLMATGEPSAEIDSGLGSLQAFNELGSRGLSGFALAKLS